jgi:hypothetical protein
VPASPDATPRVEVDPLFVRISNGHYTAAFSRRHGGALYGLSSSTGKPLLAGPSEVYTDWGLFEKGVHIASEWETNPRLTIREADGAVEIVFSGALRRPAWNGVAAGPVADPAAGYTLTYRADSSEALNVTVGVRPTTDRPDANAFLAFRIPFAASEWSVTGGPQELSGRPGAQAGQRVYQARVFGTDRDEVRMQLNGEAGSLMLNEIGAAGGQAQNPFLIDGGPGVVQLFFAMLDGEVETLNAGVERSAGFRISVGGG